MSYGGRDIPPRSAGHSRVYAFPSLVRLGRWMDHCRSSGTRNLRFLFTTEHVIED